MTAWKWKKVADAQAVLFKRLYGVKPVTFHNMLLMLQKEFDALHKNGGKPPKLTVEDKRYSTLKYLREYRTMDRIATEYGVCKGTVYPAIQWVEATLVKDGTFALPGKKALKRTSESIRYILVDVTESPLNRSKKNQKAYYSEKKSATPKTPVILERKRLEIIDAQEAKGSEHDFTIYNDTMGKDISNSIPLDADRGYLGIEPSHSNSFIPVKSSKTNHLSKEEKAYTKELVGRRVVIKYIHAKIKTFKSMAYPYRDHCGNRHSLRMTLICGIINYDKKF
jgi:hypothetical protein